MPGCILHVSGAEFNADAFLAGSGLRPYRIHHKGELKRRSGTFSDSGFSLSISDVDGDLDGEVADAIQFLEIHEAELRRLRDFSGVTDIRLDFGIYRRESAAQSEFLPPELVALAGRLGIGVELSHYAASSAP